MSYSRENDRGTFAGGLLLIEGVELLATWSVADCTSLLEPPRLWLPLCFERLVFLLHWGEPVLLVELGEAKEQKKFAGDFIVAEKTSLACMTDTSGHEQVTSRHEL